ncbi:MAG TPA: hypothetical protein ENI27_09230 [bacterium]|nr:hypothetical protein [bacterium]
MRPSRLRRIAINRAEIRKRCKLFGPIMEGARACRGGILREKNPHKGKERWAWFNGWDAVQEKKNAP